MAGARDVVIPLIRKLESIFKLLTADHLGVSAAGHTSLCASMFLLQNGLCRPQEERDQKSNEQGEQGDTMSGDAELGEGTGLGSGTGQDDISQELAKQGADMG